MESLAISLCLRTWGGPRPAQSRAFVSSMLLLGALATLAASPKAETIAPPKAATASALDLPVYFEVNRGQIASDAVRFVARATEHTAFLTETGAVMALRQPATKGAPASEEPTAAVHMRLEDANPTPRIVGGEPLQSHVNYYLGRDPRRWREGVPTYREVRYHGVYPGIDLVFHGRNGLLEYDFVISPKADADSIRLDFAGADALRLDADGALVLETAAGPLVHGAPQAYQGQPGARQVVPARYVLSEDNQVAFALGPYDHEQTLIIDPTIAYSTYLGGEAADIGFTVAVDSTGMYLAGSTYSEEFPATDGSGFGGTIDAFVAKLSPAGDQLLYATYLGGDPAHDWDDTDQAFGIAVEGGRYAYVAGSTQSEYFPTTAGAYQSVLAGPQDGFVAKLDTETGQLVYSTYLGGENLDEANGIAIDQGYAYVAGRTFSTSFPMVYPAQPTLAGMDDAFVAKVAPNGDALAYSTYLGGNNSDFAYALAVDDSGDAYVTGRTASATFGGASSLAADDGGGGSTTDVFVAKLAHEANQNAELAYLLFLGGGDNDVGRGIAVDGQGYAYVTGRTTSEDFPTTPGAYQEAIAGEVTKGRSYNDDAFAAKVQQDGSGLVYATYLGAGGVDVGYAVAVDAQFQAYLVGTTDSTDFPTVNAVQDSLAGSSGQGKNLMEDGFITVLTADGSDLVFSSYYGGTDHDMARGIALDESGSMYVVGRTASDDLPTVGALDDTLYGVVDAFLVKIDP